MPFYGMNHYGIEVYSAACMVLQYFSGIFHKCFSSSISCLGFFGFLGFFLLCMVLVCFFF